MRLVAANTPKTTHPPFLRLIVLLIISVRAYVEGLAAFLGNKERAKNVLAKYMRRNQPEFLEETFDTAAKYLEPIPRIVPAILDFAGMKEVIADEVAARVDEPHF